MNSLIGLFNHIRSLAFAVILLPSLAFSSAECMDFDGSRIEVNNQRALLFKQAGRNTDRKRVNVEGQVVSMRPGAGTHTRFSVRLGEEGENDTIEFVFNRKFGDPKPRIGQKVSACGDMIVSRVATDRYLPSPDGAIVHWLHSSKREHPGGYLKIDGKAYGEREVGYPPLGFQPTMPVRKSADVPKDAPCFAVDERGIVKNPNYKKDGRSRRNVYGFISDGENIFKVESEDTPQAELTRTSTSIWRFFRENLARREYDGCGEPGKPTTNRMTFTEIVNAVPQFPPQVVTDRFLACFDVDSRGVVKNPNYGVSGKPFSKSYGFVESMDGSVYGVPYPDSATVRPYPEFISIEHTFIRQMRMKTVEDCLTGKHAAPQSGANVSEAVDAD